MISFNENILAMINAPSRQITARVELFEGSASVDTFTSTLIDTFTHNGALKQFAIDRVGEDSKFFGFGVCQKLTVKLRDKERKINVTKDNIMEISFGVDGDYTYPCPLFRVETVTRDENNNDLSIIAYDFLYKAGEHRVEELALDSYTIGSFVSACANVLGLPIKLIEDEAFNLTYDNGANFDGSETIREALNAVAEATQTIYYVDWDWRLTFKRLDKDAEPVINIDKSKYFTLTSKEARTLTSVCHATELGDNVSAGTNDGVTQYVRNNPFWDLRDDIDILVGNALTIANGTTINQFNITWRGNWFVEIGDRISMTTKDDNVIYGYIINDTITYTGGLKQNTHWNYTEHTGETASNPITIGDVFKQTYARVDKANREITLLAQETETKIDGVNQTITDKTAEIKLTTDAITQRVSDSEQDINGINENIASLEVRAEGISAQVSSVESVFNQNLSNTNSTIQDLQKELEDSVGSINEDIVTLTSSVNAKMSAQDVQLQINTALSNGTHKVETTTGYKFDSDGLSISKTGSEMTTQITEDGMTVYRSGDAVLVADNEGVKAEDLHATTYLIVGVNSRFEDYDGRTGCFWIGG